MSSSRTALSCLLVGMVLSGSGCATMWHEMQPHRLMKWNNGPAPSLDPEFSLNDRHDQSTVASVGPGNAADVVRAQSPRD